MSEHRAESIRLIVMVLAVAVGRQAQTSRGTVTGTVLDPTGAVVDGALVILTGVETGVKLDFATSTPNAVTIDQRTTNSTGRGDPNWFEQLPIATPRPPSLLDTQSGTFEKNFRLPYTERWSFGLQRQLRGQMLLDVSYVGAEGHHLTTRADLNPLQPSGLRLHPNFGPRIVRTVKRILFSRQFTLNCTRRVPIFRKAIPWDQAERTADAHTSAE